MSHQSNIDGLREMLVDAGVGWLVAGQHQAAIDERLSAIATEITEVEHECALVFGRPVPLRALLQQETERFRPLIQTFALPMTAKMRAMVYCVIGGAQIAELEYRYEARKVSRIRVVLITDAGQRVFESDEHWDAEILHHLGLAKAGGRPLIDGYHAFRTS